jgi:hypothetical protein
MKTNHDKMRYENGKVNYRSIGFEGQKSLDSR